MALLDIISRLIVWIKINQLEKYSHETNILINIKKY